MSSYNKWLVENQAVISEDIQNDALSWLNAQAIEHGHDSVTNLNCGSESFVKIPKNGKLSGSKAGYKATLAFYGHYPCITVLYSHHSSDVKPTYSSKRRVKELWTAHKENRDPAPLNPVVTSTPQNNAVTAPKKSTVASDLSRFDALESTGEHDYLARKQISTVHGSQLRFGSDKQGKYIALLVTDFKGTRRGVQRIYEGGAKRFSTCLEKVGGFICIGNYAGAAKIVICEGYATGASIHLATGYAVLCALDAGNLAHVATGLKIWLELNNQKSIVIVAADNDASKPTNIGLTKARAACESTGFSLAYPTSNDSADFSDLHVTQGLSAVQACIDSVCNSHFRGLLIDGYTKQGEIKLLPQGKAALVIRDNCSLLLGYDSVSQEFRTYSSGQWSINTSLKDDLFSWVVEQTDGGAFSSSWFEGVMSLLRNTCGKNFHGAFSLNKHLIPFKNGVFNSKKKELLPHSPDFLLTYQLPHSYDPSASCPKFQKFLLQMVTHDSLVQVLRAYINAVIYSKVELQRYLELIGTGGTGKSTFCEVIIELVGINNHYSAGSLENFEKDKHEAGNTVLKKLIIFPDQSGYASNPSNLKRFIGGDYLVNRPLFKSGVPFKNESGLVIVTANQPIVTSDNSNGMKRRRITLRCDTPPAVRNYNLSLELCEEIPGIINWALSLLDSDVAYLLSDNNVATELRQQDLDNLLSTNPLARFFYENTEPCENSRIPIGIAKLRSLTKESLDDNGVIARATEREYKDSKTHLYPCYLDWDESRKGNNSGKKSIAHNRFSAESEEIIKHQLKWTGVYFERNSKGSFLCGIRFKPALSSQDNDVYAPAPEPYAPVYESENPAPMTVQTVPIAAPAPVVPHFYESILHGGDRQKMLKNWHNMTRRLNPVEKLELKRLSEKAYQQAFESEPNEVKRENAGCAAGTEYLRKWADSHGVVSQ